MRYSRLYLLSSAAVFLLSASAYGQNDPRQACREDVRSFCSDVQPGGGRIKDCLEQHYKDVSDNCYAVLKKANSRRLPPPPEGADNGEPPPPRPGDDNGGPPPPPPRGENGGYAAPGDPDNAMSPPDNNDGSPPPPPRDNGGPPPDYNQSN